MIPETICPACNEKLPNDAPGGLCMNCLLHAAISPTDVTLDKSPEEISAASNHIRSNLKLGQVLGNYRIVRLLGAGGMGTVFEAEELESNRLVALKVLSHGFTSDDLGERFLQEGRIAASINHPNSVYVYGTDIIQGYPIIAMELVGGGTLKDWLKKEKKVSIVDSVDAILDLLKGLQFAAEKGILHRDIKPENCFVGVDGTVKIGDFGLSISTLARGDLEPTTVEPVMGTPAFASPEQLRGEDLDVRSDIYSVGSTLYYLLTGQTVYNEANLNALMVAVLEKPAKSPKLLRSEIPKPLAQVILRCLEKPRGSRYTNYAELREALLPFSSQAAKHTNLMKRAAAYWLDVSLVDWCVTTGMLGVTIFFQDYNNSLDHDSSPLMQLTYILAIVLYFTVFDSIKSGTLAKRALRIQVTNTQGVTPNIWVTFCRTLIIVGVLKITTILFPPSADVVHATWWIFGLGLIFSSARQKNGYSGWHDLLTGTRVLSWSTRSSRAALPQTTEVITNVPKSDIGPYATLAEIGCEESPLTLGYDLRLLRRVWIQQKNVDSAPMQNSMFGNSRRGNLRWITGQRTSTCAWDAWEALDGQPFVNISKETNWDVSRYWLADLAKECKLAHDSGELPQNIGLDQVWITEDGHAKLLPFRAPGIKKGIDIPTPNQGTGPAQINSLLNQCWTFGEFNHSRTTPLHATKYFSQQQSDTPITSITDILSEFCSRPATISSRQHYTHLLPPFLLVCIGLVVSFSLLFLYCLDSTLTIRKLLDHHKREMNISLSGNSRESEEEKSRKMTYVIESYIAGLAAARKKGPLLEELPLFQSQKNTLKRILTVTPNPSEQTFSKARTTLTDRYGEKLFDETIYTPMTFQEVKKYWPAVNFNSFLPWALIAVSMFCLAGIGVIALVSAILFRQGMLFKLSGIAIVDKEGHEVGRIRRSMRMFLAFLPFTCGSFITLHFLTSSVNLSTLNAVLGGLFFGALFLVLYPILFRKRSVQDILTNTYLVIR